MKDIELARKLRKIMEKSTKCLLIARQHHDQCNYDEAASRAYYAVFHSLQAVLLTRGLSFSRHSGVKGAFNREFVHKKYFPRSSPRRLSVFLGTGKLETMDTRKV